MKRFLILLAAMAIVLPACTNDNNNTPTTPTISVEEITAKVTEFLDAGEISFSVDFTPGTQTEMHAVVISLISEAKTEGAIISSDLSASSVTYTLHATFADALAAWENNTTLTLLADTEYNDKEIDILNKSVILDLNGKELKTSQSPLFSIGKEDYDIIEDEIISIVTPGEMAIRDSGENGAITTSIIFGVVYGILTLEGGTLNNSIRNYGTFNMMGGKIIMSNHGSAVDNWRTANISGGILSGPNCIWTNSGSVTNISGNPTIKGTDFNLLNKSQAIYAAADATVTISGTPTLIGGSNGEIFICHPITLNTQPTDGKWRISIDTSTITVFAIPGEGIDLDASKFESALEGYEVQKLDDGSLAMIKITE